MDTTEATRVTVYPVGFFADLRRFRHHRSVRTLARNVVRGARRRNYWNGYLAEVDYPGTLPHTRCGRGWTRRSAARSLGLRLWLDSERTR